MSEDLRRLAEAYGIEPGYVSASGEWRETSDETRRALLQTMGAPAATDAEIRDALGSAPERDDAPVTARAWRPDWLDGARAWGLSCQLYGLRSRRNWGIGDFEDLARLAEIGAAAGADFIGINPLHALFPDDAGRFGPYAPSSRQFLNVLCIAPDRVPEFDAVAGRLESVTAGLDALRNADLVDYPAVAAAKAAAFEAMYAAFDARPDADRRRKAFAAYREARGAPLERHCLYEALAWHFARAGAGVAWTQWPDPYRDPHSPEVAAFAVSHGPRIACYAWLQWLAETQLQEAQSRARAAGMRIGLYLDIAVGVAPDGAMTWAEPAVAVAGAEIGAPPDPLGPEGQQWGLAPLAPAVLERTGLAAFHALLAATMRHAGAVRIDHAMGLQRLFWIPHGKRAADGAYMRYPMARMFAAVAHESHMARCIVIGEDLGTVPPGFRETMGAAGLFAYRVLYFERDDGRFARSGEHTGDALICVSTHDLPTLMGWWRGRDVAWRRDLGLADPHDAQRQLDERARDRALLLEALGDEGLRPDGASPDGPLDEALLVAIHRFVARAPSRLLAVQLDDALGAVEQANLPGTTAEHPNWRRRIACDLEDIPRHPLFKAVTEAAARERPRP